MKKKKNDEKNFWLRIGVTFISFPGKVPDHEALQLCSCWHFLTGEHETTLCWVAPQWNLPGVDGPFSDLVLFGAEFYFLSTDSEEEFWFVKKSDTGWHCFYTCVGIYPKGLPLSSLQMQSLFQLWDAMRSVSEAACLTGNLWLEEKGSILCGLLYYSHLPLLSQSVSYCLVFSQLQNSRLLL